MGRSGWDLQRPILGSDGRQIAPDFLRYLQGMDASGAAKPGPEGPAGSAGETGPGVPPGGAAGEVLAKSGGADFDSSWIVLADIARSGSASDLDAGTLPTARMPALSGDVATASGSVATTLATVNAGPGAFGDASHSASLTVNAKGLVTAAGSQAIAIGASAVSGLAAIATSGSATNLTAGTVPAARMPALTGDVTTTAGGVATTLKTVNANVGAFGDAGHSASLTVNAKGLVTAAGSQVIAIGASAVSGLAPVATSGSAADLGTGTLPAARLPALTGDVTTASGAVATTLNTVNANVGAFGDAGHSASFTVNAKGLVTAAGSQAIAIGASAVSGLATVATSGNAADLGTGVLPDARLSNVITAGSGGDASHTTALTWDAHGRLTAATPTAIAIASGAVSGLGTAATRNTGASGAAVPLLNAANTWSTTQTFTVAPAFADAAGTRTALGLGGLATQSGTFSGTSSGSNTGDQTFSLSVPPIFTAGGSSTSTLSFSVASQAANLIWAGPSSGAAAAPGFRALAAADIPSLDAAKITTGVLAAAQAPALTGDVTSAAGTAATTLATVNGSPGTFGDSGHVAQVTVNAKGLATAATSVAISPAAIGAEGVANKDASGGYPSFSSGTWTPVVAFATPGTSSFSYSARFGQYVQIGNLVYLDFFITFTPTIGTGSGTLQIASLPFNLGADLDSVGTVRGLGSAFIWPTGTTQASLAAFSASALQLSCIGSAVSSTTMKAANLTSGASHTVGGTIIYRK